MHVQDFLRSQRRREFLALPLVIGAAAVFGAACAISPILAAALLAVLVLSTALWFYPRTSLYFTLISVCVVDSARVIYPDSFTDRIPLFSNLSNFVPGVPVNPFELFLVLSVGFGVLRGAFLRTGRIRLDSLLIPMAVYVLFVVIAFFIGVANGGDVRFAIPDVRTQLYFVGAYLLGSQAIESDEGLERILRTFVVCVGIKGILYSFRWRVTLRGAPLPEQGVGCHEEVLFFNLFVVLLLVLALCKSQGQLQRRMWFVLPAVIVGNLACNRRAATAALIIAFITTISAAYVGMPPLRKKISYGTIVLVCAFAVYFPIFKDGDGVLSQPANAIESAINPSASDAASDKYREYESYDLMATMCTSPIIGYGYGREFLNVKDISYIANAYRDYRKFPHNTILWIWMATGTLGFLAFWVMMCAVIIRLCRTLRRVEVTPNTRIMGTLALAAVSMVLTVGAVDMALNMMRPMLIAGLLLGLACGAERLPVTAGSERSSGDRGKKPVR